MPGVGTVTAGAGGTGAPPGPAGWDMASPGPATDTSSTLRSGGAAFKSGWAVDSVRATFDQSSPVRCSTAARYSSVTGSLSFAPARNLYSGRHDAWLTR